MSRQPKATNIEAVRKTALAFLNFPVYEALYGTVQHPFFQSVVLMADDNSFFNLFEKPEEFETFKKKFAELIKGSSLDEIFALMQKPYLSSFLKFTRGYLSKRDFDKFLAYVWVCTENPNQDVNVSLSTYKRWFRAAERNTIMSKDELKVYNSLPGVVSVYRGVGVGRAEAKGLSWTYNLTTAEWFAHRYDSENKKGYVLKGYIKKEDVFAYFNERNEDEILCDPSKIFDLERM